MYSRAMGVKMAPGGIEQYVFMEFNNVTQVLPVPSRILLHLFKFVYVSKSGTKLKPTNVYIVSTFIYSPHEQGRSNKFWALYTRSPDAPPSPPY